MACVGDAQKPSSNRMWWEPILAGIQRQEGNTLGLTDYHLPSLHRVLTTARSQHANQESTSHFTRQRKVCGDGGAAVGALNAPSGRKKDSLP